ncbi:MAG TPA: CBS domain-containing protein [Anaerolineales bacterium]|nr:CBS domain-containing protein [Anaerolineales bacterium]
MIKDCMKLNVVSIPESATILSAAMLMVKRHVGILPVVNAQKKLVGTITIQNLLSLEVPAIIALIDDLDFLNGLGAIETTRPTFREVSRPVTELLEPLIFVNEDSGLLYAYSLMIKHNLSDLPVVSDDMTLVGIVSRVDIGVKVLSSWDQIQEITQ